MITRVILLLAIVFGCLNVEMAFGQELSAAEKIRMIDQRIEDLETKINKLRENPRGDGALPLVLFLYGAFCALWAQKTGRSPWLWFFLGCGFTVITLIVLLTKNADDRFDRRVFGRTLRDRESAASRFGD